MEEPVGWRFVAIGVEGDSVLLGGVDAWSAPWTPAGDSLTVPHPQYPERRHRFTQYSVKTPSGEVVFALVSTRTESGGSSSGGDGGPEARA